MSNHSDSESAKLVTLPRDWPGQPLAVMPGDGSKYIPQGLGLGAPMIVRPWDHPVEFLDRPNFYGFDRPDSDPIRAAPSNLPAGGVIYFDDSLPEQSVRTVLDAMGVQTRRRDFAAFKWDAEDTRADRYLTQLRLIARSALAELFGAGAHTAELKDQAVTIEQAVLGFLEEERRRWSDPRYAFSSRLSGTLGGDGDWAKEALAFGFLVENSYWSVYRVWSRPQLVTK
jgi:hypothetical protein